MWTRTWSEVKVAQSCLALCDPMDYALHGILQARILERVAFLFSRVSFQPRDQTQVSHIAGIFFTSWALNKYIIIKLPCIHYLDLIRIKHTI